MLPDETSWRWPRPVPAGPPRWHVRLLDPRSGDDGAVSRRRQVPENRRRNLPPMSIAAGQAGMGGICKTVGSAYDGSNPSPATTQTRWSEAFTWRPGAPRARRRTCCRLPRRAARLRWSARSERGPLGCGGECAEKFPGTASGDGRIQVSAGSAAGQARCVRLVRGRWSGLPDRWPLAAGPLQLVSDRPWQQDRGPGEPS